MKQKGLICSVAILIALTGVYVAANQIAKKSENETEENVVTDTISKTVTEEELAEITILSDDEKMVFQKAEDTWIYPENGEIPIDSQKVSSKYSGLMELVPERILEEPGELSEYGLENPSVSVTIKKTDDSSFTYLFGNLNSQTGDCYMLVQDEDTIYTVDGEIMENLQFSIYDVAEMETLPQIDSNNIKELSVKKNGVDFVTFCTDTNSGTSPTIILEDGTELFADSTQLNTLKTTAANLTYLQMADHQSKNKKEYGLDEDRAEIIIVYDEMMEEKSDEEEIIIEAESEEERIEAESEEESVQYEEKTLRILIGETDANGNYYVQGNDCTGIYTMDAASLEAFLDLSEEDYADKTIHTISTGNLESLEVTYQGHTEELYVEEEIIMVEEYESETEKDVDSIDETEAETETLLHCFAGGEEVDSSTFQTLLNKLSALKAQSRRKLPVYFK